LWPKGGPQPNLELPDELSPRRQKRDDLREKVTAAVARSARIAIAYRGSLDGTVGAIRSGVRGQTRSCRCVWLASRFVHRRIIGRVSFKRLALRFA